MKFYTSLAKIEGMVKIAVYSDFGLKMKANKNKFLKFLMMTLAA